MEESLSPSEKLAIRRVMEDTIIAGGSFNFGEVGSRVMADLWPKLAEAVADNENFEVMEIVCERLVAEALVSAKKNIPADDIRYVKDLMEIVLGNAKETYCELRGIPCEVGDTKDEGDEETMGRLIHVDFGRRPSM